MLASASLRTLFFLLVFPTLLCGKILETNSILSVLEHIQEGTLVISDIDNTLIESETQLGSSQWADYLGTLFTTPDRSFEEVDLLVAELWSKVQPLIKIRCVDPKIPQVVKQLHEQKVKFIGLTARRPHEIHYTLKQLASVQIAFTHNVLDDGFLNASKGIIFQKGIIFCTPNNKKSCALKLFLENSSSLPDKIIFLDDKLSHVHDVGQLVENLGIAYVGIRFSCTDERVASFCPDVAKIQFEQLPKIISDEEALILYNK